MYFISQIHEWKNWLCLYSILLGQCASNTKIQSMSDTYSFFYFFFFFFSLLCWFFFYSSSSLFSFSLTHCCRFIGRLYLALGTHMCADGLCVCTRARLSMCVNECMCPFSKLFVHSYGLLILTRQICSVCVCVYARACVLVWFMHSCVFVQYFWWYQCDGGMEHDFFSSYCFFLCVVLFFLCPVAFVCRYICFVFGFVWMCATLTYKSSGTHIYMHALSM